MNVAASVAEARHGAALDEQREVWRSEGTHARLAEAHVLAREQTRLAEYEVARA